MAYRRTAISSFLRAVLVMSVIGLAFLPCGLVFTVLPDCSCCSLLKATCSEWFPDKVSAGQSVPPSSFFLRVQAKLSRLASAPASLALKLLVVSSAVWVGADSTIMF
jgi:hypothetical protein